MTKLLMLMGMILAFGATRISWAQAKEDSLANEFSLGLTGGSVIKELPAKMWSADFLWRPGKRACWGISAASGEKAGYLLSVSTTTKVNIETKSLTFLIGYWSNREKKKLLGWHAFLGLGMVWVDFNKEYIAEPINKLLFGGNGSLGFDIYLLRNSKKCSLVLTFDAMAVTASTSLRHRLTGENILYGQEFDVGVGSPQAGLRLWW